MNFGKLKENSKLMLELASSLKLSEIITRICYVHLSIVKFFKLSLRMNLRSKQDRNFLVIFENCDNI